MTFDELTSEDRLRLMRFICSFAWADLEIADSEKDFVRNMGQKMSLSDDEMDEVEGWLEVPPLPEDIDPMDIPESHRNLFLSTAMQVVGADGVVDPAEMENLALLEQLLRS